VLLGEVPFLHRVPARIEFRSKLEATPSDLVIRANG
jgi:hypothetical protein